MRSVHIFTTSIACLAGMVVGAPAVQPRQSNCTSGNVVAPILYNIYPGDVNKVEPTTKDIDLQNKPGEVEREQVIVFSHVPAGAKTCSLRWNQAAKDERSFVVEGNGSTRVRPFYQSPAVAPTPGNFTAVETQVSYASTKPLSDAATKELSPDFSFWPDTESATPHTAGDIACAENIYLHVRIFRGAEGDQSVYDGDVKFKQDTLNGWELKWTC